MNLDKILDIKRKMNEAEGLNWPFLLCGECGGNRNGDVSEAKRLVREAGLISESMNPGGRELVIKNRGRLQLGDQCSGCDLKAIKTFLGVSVHA